MAFRATFVCMKKFTPSPSAPTQVILKLVEKLGSPTSEELWQVAKSNTAVFNSKNHMKKVSVNFDLFLELFYVKCLSFTVNNCSFRSNLYFLRMTDPVSF